MRDLQTKRSPTDVGKVLSRKPAEASQSQAKKMQSQMQSQTKNNTTMASNLLNIMVSRAGLEPATTALKVRRRLLNLQFRAENNGLWLVRECTGLHRMFDLRYQTWYQTNTISSHLRKSR